MIETGGHGWMGAPATGTSVAGKYSDTVHTHTVPPHVACTFAIYLSELLQGSSQLEGEGNNGGTCCFLLRPN